MERISIFNYEAFYLDHLEGNLGKEDTALLLAFLEKHPELKMDDDEFPMLEAESFTLKSDEKQALKQVDDNEAITLTNVEHFMIADAEGIIEPTKKKELDTFVANNTSLQRERKWYNAVYLKADTTIVYGDKSGLKRKKAIVLWPYIAGAAAACIIAFFVMFSENTTTGEPSQLADDTQNQTTPDAEKEQTQAPFEVVTQDNEYVAEDLPTDANNEVQTVVYKKNSSPSVKPPKKTNKEQTPSNVVDPGEPVYNLNRRPAKNLIGNLDEQKLAPVTPGLIEANPLQENTTVAQEDFASSTGFEHMKDPIQPLTKQIKKRVINDFDFRTAKTTKEKSGGFYLKIGKLEISHKKHKKK